jgi:hypothetical protein
MKKTFFLLAALTLILFFSFRNSSDAIFKWVDEKGNIHIADYPKPTREQEKEENAPQNGQVDRTAPARDERDAQPRAASPDRQQERVQPRPFPAPVGDRSTDVQKPQSLAPQMPAQQTGQGIVSSMGKTSELLTDVTAPVGKVEIHRETPVAAPSRNVPSAKIIAAFVSGFVMTFFLVYAGLYLYGCLCLFLIAKKLDVPAAWTAWLPVLQLWAFFRSAGKSLWWILLFFIPLVNAIVGVYLWMCIVENLGRNKWMGLLMLLPIINLVFLGVLAFSKKEGEEVSRPAAAY